MWISLFDTISTLIGLCEDNIRYLHPPYLRDSHLHQHTWPTMCQHILTHDIQCILIIESCLNVEFVAWLSRDTIHIPIAHDSTALIYLQLGFKKSWTKYLQSKMSNASKSFFLHNWDIHIAQQFIWRNKLQITQYYNKRCNLHVGIVALSSIIRSTDRSVDIKFHLSKTHE